MTGKWTSFIKYFGMSIVALCLPLLAQAGSQPTFSIVPTTQTQVVVPNTGSVTVNYQVTNQTKITRTLTMVPINGISQTASGPGVCSKPFTLAPNQSCILSLQLHGDTLPTSFTGGPVVCKTTSADDTTPSPFLCSQPSLESSLNISVATLTSIRVFHGRPLFNDTVPQGLSRQFYAIGIFSNGSFSNLTQNVTWSSSSPTIAFVSNASGSNGLVTGVGVGSATISATLNSTSGSAPIQVVSATISALQITPTDPSIAAGTTQQFTATGLLSDGSTIDLTTQVNWASSIPSIAVISNTAGSQGSAQGITVGTTTISATYGAQTASTSLSVSAATLTTIQITPPNPFIPKGTTQQFMATGIFSDSTSQDLTSSVTWSSSNAIVATINNGPINPGLATGVGTGGSIITATYGSVSGHTLLSVTTAQLVSIQILPYNSSIPSGITLQYKATGVYTDSTTQNLTTAVVWSSTNSSVATVSNAPDSQGLAVGQAVGSTTITATMSGVTGYSPLTVTSAVLTSIAVTPVNQAIPLGTTQQFAALGTFSDASVKDLTTEATWTSSSTSIATISNATGNQGLAQSVSVGGTTIQATFSAISGNTTLAITPATLVSITVTPANSSIPRDTGSTQQMTATGIYSDASTKIITTEVLWISGNERIVTVSNAVGSQGLVTTATVAATTTITATKGAVSGSTPITVFVLQVGQSYGGGIIACAGGGLLNLIAATADNSTGVAWGGTGIAVGPGAQSVIDGATNTQAIVSTIGISSSDAAGVCTIYAGGGYHDWFLPAQGQLNCLWSNKGTVGGFVPYQNYWSSTEASSDPMFSAISQEFSDHGYVSISNKSSLFYVRCVRSFYGP